MMLEVDEVSITRVAARSAGSRNKSKGVYADSLFGSFLDTRGVKDRARARAFTNWEIDFYRERCISDFRANVTGHPSDGHAHTFVITEPPSEHHHPLWSAATAVEKDERGKKTKRPLYTRRTTSTAFQLAVDHAFTGSYAQRFRPSDTPETLACPCGVPLRTPQHITRECPLFYQTRVNHAIHTHGRTISYPSLYSSPTQTPFVPPR
jgi:hypothetical protein